MELKIKKWIYPFVLLTFAFSLRAFCEEPAEIIEGKLYLSSVVAAENKEVLDALKITHIVNLTGPEKDSDTARYPNKFPESFKYVHLKIKDEMKDVPILRIAQQAHEFMDAAFTEGRSRVLVHCEAGISRSSTIVISYLMKTNKMTLKEAYDWVIARKPNIGPNQGFFGDLLRFERNLEKKGKFYVGTGKAIPSITLRDLLADQLKRGAAEAFDLELIKIALDETQNRQTREYSSDAAYHMLCSWM